ncbi:transposon Tf2-6 polyprotein, partial [Nephila pilipes]
DSSSLRKNLDNSSVNIRKFCQYKDLIISGQIKRHVPPEVRDHFLDDWSEWVSPSELADKLDIYCSSRNTTPSVKKMDHSREYLLKEKASSTFSFSRNDKLKTNDRSERPSVSCYGCGKPGVMKSRCPNCKPTPNSDSANFSISLHSCSLTPNQPAVLKLAVNGTWGTAWVNSGARNSNVGETLDLFSQREGANFQKIQLSKSLADYHKSEVEVYTISVVIRLKGNVIHTPLISLPYAKVNLTLLGMDFLQKVGILQNLKYSNWFFNDL